MRTLPILLALTGCLVGDNGGQSGSETIGCLPTSTTDLASDEQSALGFSADDLMTNIGGTTTDTLTYDAGGTSELTLVLTASGTPQYEEREWVDDGSGNEIAMIGDCGPTLVVPATLSVTTADGALAESWDIELEATTVDGATWFTSLTGFDGTLDPDTTGFDDYSIHASGGFDDTSWGEIRGQGENTDGQTASATNIPLASWGVAQ